MIEAARSKAQSFNLREQLSALNLHWAGLGVLALVNLYLLITLGVLWNAAKGQDADALAQQRVVLAAAKQAARPLEGLDEKLQTANRQADRFSADRLPVGYSEVATELGELSKTDAVRLTRVQYTQAPVVNVAGSGQLTEVRMDASLAGDYRGLVEFINGLERDDIFFVINGVALTGQESGKVNLRMKLTTYLRGLSSDEEAKRYSTPVETDVSGGDPLGGPVGASAPSNPQGGLR